MTLGRALHKVVFAAGVAAISSCAPGRISNTESNSASQGSASGADDPDPGAPDATTGAAGSSSAGGRAGVTNQGGSKGSSGGATNQGGNAGRVAVGGTAGKGGASSSTGGTHSGIGGMAMTKPPPPPPAPCNGLAPAGTWEALTPVQTPGADGVLTAVVDPQDHATVYTTVDGRGASGARGGIYKSVDCGATWTKLNTGRNGAVIDSGMPFVFLIDPHDDDVMYTSPLYGNDLRIFKSVDGGANWDPLFKEGDNVYKALVMMFTEIFSLDTANSQHLVANFHNNCVAPYTPVCLAETYDGGQTWQVINGPSSLTGWVEDAGPIVIDDAIYLGVPGTGLFYSKDHGASWSKVAPAGYFYMYQATNDYYYMGGYHVIQRSKDLQHWTDLMGTPTIVANAIVGDGQRLFAAARYMGTWVASPETDGMTWTSISGPPGGIGSKMLAYDSVNHVLYSASEAKGLFRMVTH